MGNKRYALGLAAMATTILATMGCSNGDNADVSESQTSTPGSSGSTATVHAPNPTLTQSNLQPPDQHNQYTAGSGRPEVAFDPCTWIPDSAIQKAGLSPSSRKRGDDQVAEITFLTCRFTSPTSILSVMSGNATWDEDVAKNSSWSEPVQVNGRQGMWVRDPKLKDRCEIHLQTKVGFAIVGATVTSAGLGKVQACDGLLDIASAIEPSIGTDN